MKEHIQKDEKFTTKLLEDLLKLIREPSMTVSVLSYLLLSISHVVQCDIEESKTAT